ncbi:MAG: hypothetical protein VYD64_00205, partial [Pseudomonadota bacterium]|nr:hypothetical protein [Pseudomonadota bacterium]
MSGSVSSIRGRTIRRAVRATFVAGLLNFLLVTCIIGYVNAERALHARFWTPVTAMVERIDPLCQLQHEGGTRWHTVEIMACDDAEKAIKARPPDERPDWRKRQRDYVTIGYESGGQRHSQRLLRFLVSSVPVEEGQFLP